MGLFDKLFGSKENKAVEVEIYSATFLVRL